MLRLSIIYKHNKLYSAVKKEFSITPPPFFFLHICNSYMFEIINQFFYVRERGNTEGIQNVIFDFIYWGKQSF